MGARTCLNSAALNGCLLAAGVAGYAFQSWIVFCVVLLVLLAGSVHNRDIRLRGRR